MVQRNSTADPEVFVLKMTSDLHAHFTLISKISNTASGGNTLDRRYNVHHVASAPEHHRTGLSLLRDRYE